MSNAFGHLLNMFRIEKRRAIDDMTRDLLRKHSGFTTDDIKVDELNFSDRHVIRVALVSGIDQLDWQVAVITPSFQLDITREANLPDYHPDHPDNLGKSLEQRKNEAEMKKEADSVIVADSKEESGW